MTTHSDTTAPGPSEVEGRGAYQARVDAWMQTCFPPDVRIDRTERSDRFLEEAVELVQSMGETAERCHALVDYVFSRPAGDPKQEVGGVMVCLAALCTAAELDMTGAGEVELARVWTKIDAIRAKHAAKPKGAALPGYATLSHAQPSGDKTVSDVEKIELTEVATTSRGYTIFREPNEAGGHRYWSDSIGGGVVVWDTCLASPEELEVAMRCERERTGAAGPSDAGVAEARGRERVAKWHGGQAEIERGTQKAIPSGTAFLHRAADHERDAAAIRALSPAKPAGWQSIATAPTAKTAADRLVWVFGGKFTRPTLVMPDGSWWRELRNAGRNYGPTHWCPQHVPNPPTPGAS